MIEQGIPRYISEVNQFFPQNVHRCIAEYPIRFVKGKLTANSFLSCDELKRKIKNHNISPDPLRPGKYPILGKLACFEYIAQE